MSFPVLCQQPRTALVPDAAQMTSESTSDSAELSSSLFNQCPHSVQPHHWQEWLASGVAPDLIAANVLSLSDQQAYDYLCYSNQLDRRNDGRLTDRWLKRYTHTEQGGWWCAGVDPLQPEETMLWGCFKPDCPRIDAEGKVIKYEHPPKTPTRAFFLKLPDRLWQQIADRWRIPLPCSLSTAPSELGLNFWQWVFAHPELPIVITEGAKKAGALLTAGYVAIALPGIFNGRRVSRNEQGRIWQEQLIPELSTIIQSNRPVYFCFDFEVKPKTLKQINLAIHKTGHLLEKQGCWVQVISLPGPEKGVDDFIMAQGLAAFDQSFDRAKPLSQWQWRVHKQSELTYPTWIHLDTPELLEARLLPNPALQIHSTEPVPLLKLLPDGDLVAIASGKGTGKTKFITAAITNTTKVLLLTHRRCLGRSLAERMGLDWKADADRANGQWISTSGERATYRLGLCVDSLLSIDPNQFIGCDLVIDEVVQVLHHLLTSNTCRKEGKRPALLARLHWLVQVAHRVIIADADLNNWVLDYLRELRGNGPVYLIRNQHQRQGYPVEFIQCANDAALTDRLLQAIRSGQRLLVQTDSKDYADAIAALVPNDRKFITITSDTSGNRDEIDFVRNINQQVSQYDLVIATPSMATGVSIEVEHFQAVYGAFFGTVTDADAAQALGRVRSPIPRIVWCAQRGRNFSSIDPSEYPWRIQRALKTRWDQETCLIRASLQPDLIPVMAQQNSVLFWGKNPHLNLWAALTGEGNRAMWNLRDSLLARLDYEGNPITLATLDPDKTVRTLVTEARKQNRELEYRGIANARLLMPKERADLEGRESLGRADKQALERARLADFYALSPEAVTPELVAFDDRGRKRAQLSRLEMLLNPHLAPQKTVDEIAKQARWKQGLWIPDLPTTTSEQTARLLLGLEKFLVPGQEFSNEDLAVVGDLARRYSQDIKRWLGFSIPDDPNQANNIWIFRRMLQQLGISTQARRQGRQQTRFVSIDLLHWQEIQIILARRQHRRQTTNTLSN